MKHVHHKWLTEISVNMQNEFEEAHARASKPGGAQQSGHISEVAWKECLEKWLPPGYEVGTRRYILFETDPGDGSEVSAETDIVIFHPSYPHALRGRTEVLLSGIVAAFSVKLTLNKAGIREAVKEAARVRQAAKFRSHDLRGKILPPFLYGILAHTHSWKTATSRPVESITAALSELDSQFSNEPREALDLLCVADLNYWSKQINLVTPEVAAVLPSSVAMPGGHIQYTFLNVGHDQSIKDATSLKLPPVAFLIGLLYEKLSYYDDSLSAMADGFRLTDMSYYSLSQSATNRMFPPASILGESGLEGFNEFSLLQRIYW